MSITSLKTIHPFPARMVPEIAMRRLESVHNEDVLLDPITGLGAPLKIAEMVECSGICDYVAPMALMISGEWNRLVDTALVSDC